MLLNVWCAQNRLMTLQKIWEMLVAVYAHAALIISFISCFYGNRLEIIVTPIGFFALLGLHREKILDMVRPAWGACQKNDKCVFNPRSVWGAHSNGVTVFT